MPTSKPLSTISYNTEPFLKRVLDSMVEKHQIQLYRYIKHIGELKADAHDLVWVYDKNHNPVKQVPKYQNEKDKYDKDHFHVFIFPNKKLDPMDIRLMFLEPDINHPKKAPLGCMPFYVSSEYDWLLYAIHDPDYLRAHNSETEDGKLSYEESDVKSNEPFITELAFRRARVKQRTDQYNILKALKEGVPASELCQQGKNAIQVYSLARICSLDKNSVLEKEIAEYRFVVHSLVKLLGQSFGCKFKFSPKDIHMDMPLEILLPDEEEYVDISNL